MDPHPRLISGSSFSTANPSSCALNDTWPFPFTAGGGGGGRGRSLCPNLGSGFPETLGARDYSAAEESTVTEQSGGGTGRGRKRRDLVSSEDESCKIISTTESGNGLSESNCKRTKLPEQKCETGDSEPELGSEQNNKQEPPKDYVYVRAKRGQATDNHSLAERARREKISERMKILQNLVPGCDKVIGKALVLDEIINYVQSLQRQVEFLSMKLEAVNLRSSMNPVMKGFHSKDFGAEPSGANRMMLSPHAAQESIQGPLHVWLNMQVGGHFDGPSQ